MSIELLCTVGPSSRRPAVLERLAELGVSLFRVNLSHTSIADLPDILRDMQRRTDVPICLDTEGAQVRTGSLVDAEVVLRENTTTVLRSDPRPGTAEGFSLYPFDIVDRLEIGDLISIDFNTVLVQVIARAPGTATVRVISGGRMGRNKAVTVKRSLVLPPLTEKDRQGLKIGAQMGIEHIALSFTHRAADVDAIREAFGKPATIISKIESVEGLNNLDAIIPKVDAILIDRGDLSREIPIERIPAAQKTIIGRAKAAGCKVYVATNLLETMIVSPQPTRAEVNDVFNTLADGASGLVLAAETAIGKYPVQCAAMIKKLVHEFEQSQTDRDLGAYGENPFSMLVKPHGGQLVHQEAVPEAIEGFEQLPRMCVDLIDLLDAEQIAQGTYSPITGFMCRQTLESVLSSNRLPSGTVWTMPIILQVAADRHPGLTKGMRIVLTRDDGAPHSVLDVSEVYDVDLDDVAQRWFGTTDRAHPGVARLQERGSRFVAGAVTLVNRLPSAYQRYSLPPAQTRFVFAHKGWTRVLGFHTRNVCHRVHEHIQLEALARSNADGLFISPVIGPKKAGDFLPEPIMQSYELLLADDGVYPPGKVVLGSLATFPRYAGPREAVFTALCRKNMGCSHFIIGRDHAGVGAFYPGDGGRRLFDEVGDIGIEPMFFEAIGYDWYKERYAPLDSSPSVESISGTQLREALSANKALPEWFIRRSVQEMLQREIAAGRDVFVRDAATTRNAEVIKS